MAFHKLIDLIISGVGYIKISNTLWIKKLQGAVVLVRVQKSSLGKGMYLNFGITFKTHEQYAGLFEYECEIFGRNPASFAKQKYIVYQSQLDQWRAVARDKRRIDMLTRSIHSQLRALEKMADRTALKKMWAAGKLKFMLFNRSALGYD
jgi:hypothetical protein